jgi:hypothetical protein
MAIGQSRAISGGSRKRNQVAELNARQQMLPQIIANKRYQEEIAREDALNERNFAFQQKSAKQTRGLQDRASEVGMGLEAGKLGVTMSSRFGNKSFGDIGNSARNLWSGTKGSVGGTGMGSFFDNLSAGAAVGGGLVGFGVGKLIGKKKSKVVKGLAGAGAGAAIGLLSGGNSFGGALSGAFGGGLGGLFS